jgi:hypothetical protein
MNVTLCVISKYLGQVGVLALGEEDSKMGYFCQQIYHMKKQQAMEISGR